MIILPKQIETILQMLETNGYEGFIVGGCVRDYLLNQNPKDIDITTNAKPQIVMEIFRNYKVIATGLKHGTITVIIESMPIEITTYRIDGAYSDNRHPDTVSYTSNIEDDLARRDFTMNAIAYNPHFGFVDPYGGSVDIQNQIIRAVGNAQIRFEEDALRILRGLRFSSTLGFTIEHQTFQAMTKTKQRLQTISAERIYVEFGKTLLGGKVKDCFLQSVHIWGAVIPEILPMVGFEQNNPHHVYDVFTHTLIALENTPNELHLRLTAFFHDIGKPHTYTVDEQGVGHFYGHPAESVRIAQAILERLRCDNSTKDNVLTLVKYHDATLVPKKKNIKRWFTKLTPTLFFDLLAIKKADNLAQNPQFLIPQETFDTLNNIAQEIITNQECFSLKDLAVNGTDLIQLGYTGKEIGTILNQLLECVINDVIENDRSILLQSLK